MNQFKKEYGKTINEVLNFLEHTDEKLSQKIPVVFKEFLIENRYKPFPLYSNNNNTSVTFNDLSPKAKDILTAIYATWWCSDEEKDSYLKKIKEYELRKQFKM